MKMHTSLSSLPAAVLVLSLGGCASTSSDVRVDVAESGIPNCRSVDWLSPSNQPASFTEQRVRAAVMSQLQEKGYGQSSDQPDCRITYVLSTYERPKSKPSVGVGAGGGSGGIGGGIGVSIPVGRRNQHAGTFTLDVVDAAKNAQVWSGSMDASFASAELSEDEAASVVRRILAKFPDRAAAR